MPDDSFERFLLDQLEGLGAVEARRMFGGCGLYLDGAFFGLVYGGALYLRTDARSREEYEALGGRPFRPRRRPRKPGPPVYWSVPVDVLEDAPRLVRWARASAAIPPLTARARPRRRNPSKP